MAILMVLICHTAEFRKPGWDIWLVRSGWAGVDLFFVLSGFLIAGLLFSEYRRSGRIRFRRFAARRALKLYPAFYVLVLLTVGIRLVQHRHDAGQVLTAFIHDLFFLQSYTQGTYVHFWSLAVEEHFYILLPLVLYFMLRRYRFRGPDPFWLLPGVFAFVAVLALGLRLWTAAHIDPRDVNAQLQPTHLRMDSLLFGVLLAYWAAFRAERFWSFVRVRCIWLLAAAVVLVSPTLFLDEGERWMHTYGFATNYLGFGALLLGMLSLSVESLPGSVRTVFRILAYIGTFSYSIYLWHFAWLYGLRRLHITEIPYAGVAAYFIGAIAVGIVAAKLVEIPVLRLRERLVPAAAPVRAAATTAAEAASAVSR